MIVYALMYRSYNSASPNLVGLWEDHTEVCKIRDRRNDGLLGPIPFGGYSVECVPVNMKARALAGDAP